MGKKGNISKNFTRKKIFEWISGTLCCHCLIFSLRKTRVLIVSNRIKKKKSTLICYFHSSLPVGFVPRPPWGLCIVPSLRWWLTAYCPNRHGSHSNECLETLQGVFLGSCTGREHKQKGKNEWCKAKDSEVTTKQ